MILYFADRYMNIKGMASTELPEGLTITEDRKVEDVGTGVASFECRIQFDASTRTKVKACAAVGNYILRSNGAEKEFYTIVESESDTRDGDFYIYAEDAGLDLINEMAGPYEADKAYPISHYINMYANDSGFEIGINEIPNNTRKLKWEGESTITERIASVATQFDDCEISYSFEIEGLQVTKKYINIHKQRGKDVGVQLRLNKEVNRIIAKESIANLATALQVTGGFPDEAETPITLVGYTYDDGDFYVDEAGILRSREALQAWGRIVGDTMSHIVKQYTYDTASQETLCKRAITELKKLREVEASYEVDVREWPDYVRIGDRVNVIDGAGELYFSARVLSLESSEVEQRKTAILGEYTIKSNEVSDGVAEFTTQFKKLSAYASTIHNIATEAGKNAEAANQNAEQAVISAGKAHDVAKDAADAANAAKKNVDELKEAAESGEFKGEDATTLRIDSSRGTVFKNSAVSTVLNAVIYKGSKRITDITALKEEFGNSAYLEWQWQRMGEETFGTIVSTDKRIGNDGFSFTLSPDDVDTKVVFLCNLITD